MPASHRDPLSFRELAVLATFWFTWGVVTAQQPDSPPKPPDDLTAAAKRLDELVQEAQSLLQKGDRDGARAACQRALAEAKLEGASDAWLAAAADALWRLGFPAYQSGDLRTAHDAWEAAHRYRSRTLPEDHPNLQGVRRNLAITKAALGDLHGAHALQESVLAVRSKTLPDDHQDLQTARTSLARTKAALGQLSAANALFEKVLAVFSVTLPDDHPDLQDARENLAVTKAKLGDLQGARMLQEKVLVVRSQSLPKDHPNLQRAKMNLGSTKHKLGDLHGAQVLFEEVLAALSRTVPDDHPDLQDARQGLAVIMDDLGDLHRSHALNEKVLAVRSKTLSDDHPDLQSARANLAITKKALGDLHGAHALQESVLAVRSKTLPDDHPDLQDARANLAVTKAKLGDLQGALMLQEKVLAVRSQTLPKDHADLQAARLNLGSTKHKLGDLHGAQVLFEEVLAALSKTLADDHPDLQTIRLNLAITKREFGDLHGALALEEKVLDVRSATLPDDHADLQASRSSLAATKSALGDLHGALALAEKVFAVFSETLPEDHVDLQAARLNIAVVKRALGDVNGASTLFQEVLAALSESLPEDHPDLETARKNLAGSKAALGDLAAASQLLRSAVAGALGRLSSASVSARDAVQLAIAASDSLSHIGSLLDAHLSQRDALPDTLATALTKDGLILLDAVRGAEGHTTELLRHVRTIDPAAFDELTRAVAIANQAVHDAIALPHQGHADANGKTISRKQAFADTVFAKDRAERALMDKVPAELRGIPTSDQLAAALAPEEAAIAFLTYTQWTNDRDKPGITSTLQRFGAYVLTPAGDVTWQSLAPVADIEPLIAGVRRDALAGLRLATRSSSDTPDALPGRDPDDSTGQADTLTPRLAALRERLLAPVLATLPAGTKRIVLSLADELLLLPIEDLPLADGRALGEAFEVHTLSSLRTLLRQPKQRATKPGALVVGGIDYDSKPATPAPVVLDAATPVVESSTDAPNSSGSRPGSGRFRPLPGTATEARKLAEVFGEAFDSTSPTVLQDTQASEAAFVAQATGRTYLHLATHGYFAPESAWRAAGAHDQGALARFDFGQKDKVAQLSPFSLTGIALAGANLPADELGRREGILTAQEIAQLDLTSCYLATLSACETSLGVRRAGTGLASLCQAFHAAGARYVLATLWEVDDAEAQRLMSAFYTRLWRHGEEPRVALRAAKAAARQRGAPFRDWAGWVLTGR